METNEFRAVALSGIVPAHAQAISLIAKTMDSFILFRPVNPNSTSLIAEGFGTKGLDIHSKSSDWGPQAGFICENQLLSKAGSVVDIQKGNTDSHHSLHDSGGKVKRFPLLLTQGRLEELTDMKKGRQLFRVDGTWPNSPAGKVTVYPTKAYGSLGGRVEIGLVDYKDRAFFMQSLDQAVRRECETAFSDMMPKIKSPGSRYIVVYREKGGDFTPVFALGYAQTGLPVTADYDVFAICPNLSQFSGQMQARQNWRRAVSKAVTSTNSLSRPLTGADTFVSAVKTVQKALGQEERNRVDPEMGRITIFQQRVKDAINSRCNGMSNRVVHHGTEMDNTQFPEQDGNITVFTPTGSIGVTANWNEVQNVGQDIIRLGYVFYRNRSYTADPQKQAMEKGRKFYMGQGETNKSELFGNGKSFIWKPESGAELKALNGLMRV